MGNSELSVPDVTGMTLDEARSMLSKTLFSVGNVHFDPESTDSSSAKIYLQKPSPDYGSPGPGNTIDIYLR